MIGMRGRSLFDAAAVKRASDKAARRNLSWWGGFTRKTAQRSIRKRQAASEPGQPPSSHQPHDLRRRVLYALEPGPRPNVVVGPTLFNKVTFDRHRRPVRGTVPRVLEEGGAVTFLEILQGGRWRLADLRSRRRIAELPASARRYRTVTIEARPYMGPAARAANERLPAVWRDSIRR